MDDYIVSKLTEDEINEIGRKYSLAAKKGNSNEKKYYIGELYKVAVGNSLLNRKLKAVFRSYNRLINDADMIINDFFVEWIRYYDVEKNDKITAFFSMYFPKYLSEIAKKRKNESSIEEMTMNEDGSIDESKIPDSGKEDNYQYFELQHDLSLRLPALILGFYMLAITVPLELIERKKSTSG